MKPPARRVAAAATSVALGANLAVAVRHIGGLGADRALLGSLLFLLLVALLTTLLVRIVWADEPSLPFLVAHFIFCAVALVYTIGGALVSTPAWVVVGNLVGVATLVTAAGVTMWARPETWDAYS